MSLPLQIHHCPWPDSADTLLSPDLDSLSHLSTVISTVHVTWVCQLLQEVPTLWTSAHKSQLHHRPKVAFALYNRVACKHFYLGPETLQTTLLCGDRLFYAAQEEAYSFQPKILQTQLAYFAAQVRLGIFTLDHNASWAYWNSSVWTLATNSYKSSQFLTSEQAFPEHEHPEQIRQFQMKLSWWAIVYFS